MGERECEANAMRIITSQVQMVAAVWWQRCATRAMRWGWSATTPRHLRQRARNRQQRQRMGACVRIDSRSKTATQRETRHRDSHDSRHSNVYKRYEKTSLRTMQTSVAALPPPLCRARFGASARCDQTYDDFLVLGYSHLSRHRYSDCFRCQMSSNHHTLLCAGRFRWRSGGGGGGGGGGSSGGGGGSGKRPHAAQR